MRMNPYFFVKGYSRSGELTRESASFPTAQGAHAWAEQNKLHVFEVVSENDVLRELTNPATPLDSATLDYLG